MKLNISVELDYIDEEGNIDETVMESIIQGVKDSISKECLVNVKEKASKSIGKAMDAAIEEASIMIQTRAKEILDEWLEKDVEVTDQWGNVKVRSSIIGLIEASFDRLPEQRVDSNGRFTDKSYDTTNLISWLTDKRVKEVAEVKLMQLSKDIDRKIEEAVNAGIRERVSDKFAEMVIMTAKAQNKAQTIELQ